MLVKTAAASPFVSPTSAGARRAVPAAAAARPPIAPSSQLAALNLPTLCLVSSAIPTKKHGSEAR